MYIDKDLRNKQYLDNTQKHYISLNMSIKRRKYYIQLMIYLDMKEIISKTEFKRLLNFVQTA